MKEATPQAARGGADRTASPLHTPETISRAFDEAAARLQESGAHTITLAEQHPGKTETILSWLKGEVDRITEEAFDRHQVKPKGNSLGSSEL